MSKLKAQPLLLIDWIVRAVGFADTHSQINHVCFSRGILQPHGGSDLRPDVAQREPLYVAERGFVSSFQLQKIDGSALSRILRWILT